MTRARSDRGAAATIVVVVFTAFALGFGAIVVDVGSWYAERAQLQNGSDAAALAVAQACAQPGTILVNVGGTPTDACTEAGSLVLAAEKVNGNSNDGESQLNAAFSTGVCGTAPLTPCEPPLPSDCPSAEASVGSGFVNVYDKTKTGSGDLLPAKIGGVLMDGYEGTTIHTCARAEWGPATNVRTIPLTISTCEWANTTNAAFDSDGNLTTDPTLPPPPPYGASYPVDAYGSTFYDGTQFGDVDAEQEENVFAFHGPGSSSALVSDFTNHNSGNWDRDGWSPNALVAEASPGYGDVEHALQITWTASTDAVSKSTAVDAGQLWYASIRVKHAASADARVTFRVLSGTTVLASWTSSATSDWQAPTDDQITGDLDFTPSGNSVTLRVVPSSTVTAGTTVLIDEVQRWRTGANCSANNVNSDASGDFGWLDYDENCEATIEDGVAGANPGASGECPETLLDYYCDPQEIAAGCEPKVAYMPIFSDVEGVGQNAEYTIRGYAGFVITGMHFNGYGDLEDNPSSHPDAPGAGRYCGVGRQSRDTCIYGFFTTALVNARPTNSSGGLPGINAVSLTG